MGRRVLDELGRSIHHAASPSVALSPVSLRAPAGDEHEVVAIETLSTARSGVLAASAVLIAALVGLLIGAALSLAPEEPADPDWRSAEPPTSISVPTVRAAEGRDP